MGSSGDLVEKRTVSWNCCEIDGDDVKRQEGMIIRG